MRTTIDVDEKLLNRVLVATGEKSKSKAVNKALEEFLRQESILRLLALRGSGIIDMDYDEWYRVRHMER